MMFVPNAVISRPARTSLAKPSHMPGSSSIDCAAYPDLTVAPMTWAGNSAFETCMDDSPLECGGEQEQADEADRGGPEAGGQQCGAGAERADDHAPQRQRAELRTVAGAVVGGERAPAQSLRDALV